MKEFKSYESIITSLLDRIDRRIEAGENCIDELQQVSHYAAISAEESKKAYEYLIETGDIPVIVQAVHGTSPGVQ